MRSRNNTMRKLNLRKSQGTKPLKEKVKIPSKNFNISKFLFLTVFRSKRLELLIGAKRRNVRVIEEVPEIKISNQRRLAFRAFCDEVYAKKEQLLEYVEHPA
jgi:hypothetical protein